MTIRVIGSAVLLVVVSNCSLGGDGPTAALQDGDVTLTTSANSYEWDSGTGIEATITNHGERPYFARLGDGFNGDMEQAVLFAAAGSDGYVERRDGDSWVPLERLFLIEGVRFVVLKPGSSYTLFAHLTGRKVTGTHRLRVDYFDSEGGGAKVGEAISPHFVVR